MKKEHSAAQLYTSTCSIIIIHYLIPDELRKQGKRGPEEKAITKYSVEALCILSSSSNLQELGRLLVADKFIEEERMKAIISGLLKGKTEQARMMMSAVEAQLKHANTKFGDYLEALDKFNPLQDTVKRMRGMYVRVWMFEYTMHMIVNAHVLSLGNITFYVSYPKVQTQVHCTQLHCSYS